MDPDHPPRRRYAKATRRHHLSATVKIAGEPCSAVCSAPPAPRMAGTLRDTPALGMQALRRRGADLVVLKKKRVSSKRVSRCVLLEPSSSGGETAEGKTRFRSH